MDTIIAYLLKCIVSSGILTAYYWFVLRNKKFHVYNRFYLLFALLISLILPFLHFQWFSIHQAGPYYMNGLINTIGPPVIQQTPAPSFHWERLLIVAGLLVSAVLLVILMIRILLLFREIRTHAHIRIKGVFFIETKMENAPFSFLNYLFWKKNISLESDSGEKIFMHELTHIEQLHTYDKLFSQLAVCILWINPFYWIIQRELNMIHEFIADERSINDGDTESFARMLLLSHNEGAYLDPSHSFFHSPVKRRLAMITTSQRISFSYLRRLLALPVLLLVVTMLSFKVLEAQSSGEVRKDTLNNPAYYEKVAREQDELNGKTMNAKLRAELFSLRKTGNDAEGNERARKLTKAILNDPPDIIYYVNGVFQTAEYIKNLKLEDISAINVYTGDTAVKRYGKKAIGGVVEMTTVN